MLLLLAGYFAILLLIGYFTGKNSNNDTFFLGNRQAPWRIVAFGMIGASISGITYVSVPGMVRENSMSYLQMVLGFSAGYFVIAYILLPVYYKLNLTSIYSYLNKRLGSNASKTGAWLFIISRTVGSAAKLYIVILILQRFIFDEYHIPFLLTTTILTFLILCYTIKSGIKTIIWTDAVHTLLLLGSLALIIGQTMSVLQLDLAGVVDVIHTNPSSQIFVFDDWHSKQNFFKQFFSGIFITIVMTGLDQDMMQKNLSCRNLRESQKNMKWYGMAFIPVNFLFLCLGILLLILSEKQGVMLPVISDEILPSLAATGHLGNTALILFMLGITSATFSSADSALTALTTSFCIDILGIEKEKVKRAKTIRILTHIGISIVFVLTIALFKMFENQSILDTLYTITSYTYGPLLGLFAFGLFTRRKVNPAAVPVICIAAPVICYTANYLTSHYLGYHFGYELLMLNGALTFGGLWIKN
jgi:Na+/proline symporter